MICEGLLTLAQAAGAMLAREKKMRPNQTNEVSAKLPPRSEGEAKNASPTSSWYKVTIIFKKNACVSKNLANSLFGLVLNSGRAEFYFNI